MARDPAAVLAREIARGATILGPTGRDITQPVRSSFTRFLPACGGDRAAAAAQAVQVALGEQKEAAR